MAKNNKKTSTAAGVILMLLAAFIWGTAFIAQSKGLENTGNFTFLTFRSYLAVAALLPVSLISYKKSNKKTVENCAKKEKFFSKKLIVSSIICGTMLFFGNAAQQLGIVNSGVGKSGFLTTLYILIIPLIGLIVFKRKISPVLWGCIGIALVGMYFLCVTQGGGIGFGDIMLIICALCFSIQITAVDYYISSVDGIRLSLMQFVVCGLISTVVMLFTEQVEFSALLDSWFAVFYAGVMSSGVAFTLQILSQKHLNPVVASLIMSLESVFAALSGAVFGERLSRNEIIGCCLVFTAIIISQLPTEKLFAKKQKE